MAYTILIVDDDNDQRSATERLVLNLGYSAICVPSGDAALSALETCHRCPIDAVILDLVMPDIDGMTVLERIRKAQIRIPIIVQTTSLAIDSVQSAIRAGAADFVVKPVGRERLSIALENLLRQRSLEHELRFAQRRQKAFLDVDDFLEINPSLGGMRSSYKKAALSSESILIEGQTGVGKAAFARALHGSSHWRGNAFVSLDCSNMDERLLEFQLVGHSCTKPASRKTVFFRNIQNLSEGSQSVILKWLDGVRPLSRNASMPAIRVMGSVTGSSIDLVQSRRLREELFYRLGIYQFSLAPFATRRDDILRSALGLISRISVETGRFIRTIDPHAIELLRSHSWSGNARELERVVTQAISICHQDRLGISDFPSLVCKQSSLGPLGQTSAISPIIDSATGSMPDPISTSQLSTNFMGLTDSSGHLRPFEQIEASILRFAFDHYSGRVAEIARYLGIGRSTLYRKLRQAGILCSPELSEVTLDNAA